MLSAAMQMANKAIEWKRGVWNTVWGFLYTAGATTLAASRQALAEDPEVFPLAMQRWARGLAKAWRMPLRAQGLEKLANQPYIFMANHQSYADIVALTAVLPNRPRFIGKAELRYIPVVGQAMRAGGHIFVDRRGGKYALASMEEAAAKIRKGCSVIIFPEGTRNDGEHLGELRSGGFRLAKRAKVSIVPIGLRGTQKILPRRSWLVRSGPVELHVGEPIDAETVQHTPTQQLMARTRQAIAQLSELTVRAD